MIDNDWEVSIKNVNIPQSVIETHTCRTLKLISKTEYLTSTIFEKRKTPVLLLVVAVCFGLTRKMQTYIRECLNYVQTQLQIPSAQSSYWFGTSRSKILCEPILWALWRSDSHDGKPMIEMSWKGWKKHVSNAIFL
jgi:hypothetical protein